MRRLFVKIYLALLAIVVLCIVVAGYLANHVFENDREAADRLQPWAELLADHLPEPGASADQVETALAALHERLPGVDLTLWGPEGAHVASAGQPVLPPDEQVDGARTLWSRQRVGVIVRLSDGRWLGASTEHNENRKGTHAAFLGVLLVVMALGCYPLARQITKRIEHLKSSVEDWGRGDLGARVEPRGHDEVADLARSFNSAAERIEALVEQQKRVLAHASHELRSPLARLRMAVELMSDGARDEPSSHYQEATRNIQELDALIGEILLSSRLEAGASDRADQSVDLQALASEEAERVGAPVVSEPQPLRGDPELLRRLLRNLLENARRFSDDVEVRLQRQDDAIVLEVLDRGPGVPESDRERIFDPFYRPAGHGEGAGGVGLGLALVKQIAERHGGRVECLSRAGGGGRFRVTLPAV